MVQGMINNNGMSKTKNIIRQESLNNSYATSTRVVFENVSPNFIVVCWRLHASSDEKTIYQFVDGQLVWSGTGYYSRGDWTTVHEYDPVNKTFTIGGNAHADSHYNFSVQLFSCE